MEQCYRVKISRIGSNVAVRLQCSSVTGDDWHHLVTRHCIGFDRAQDIAEQMRLERSIPQHSFSVSVDTRG